MNKETQQDLRQILGKFLTGVTVVTTLDQHDIPVGFTANSFTSVSLDPPLVSVCLAQSAGLASVFRQAKSFAINILSSEQETVSNSFASKNEDRFAHIHWTEKSTGSPIIEGSAAWIDCKMNEQLPAGDHMILIGQIVNAEKTARHPLGYYQGQYCGIDLPDEALSIIEQRKSIHSTTGILADHDIRLLLVKQADGYYDVPRARASGNGADVGIDSAMAKLGLEVKEKVLFSVVEGRYHQRLSIYYRCTVVSSGPLPQGVEYFPLDELPLTRLSFPYLAGVLKRYAKEKETGQFAIYVGDEHQGFLENAAKHEA
jgi:flavin reductase (DIM6/NTAB) family NADH-FMN oxidoreductase RutF